METSVHLIQLEQEGTKEEDWIFNLLAQLETLNLSISSSIHSFISLLINNPFDNERGPSHRRLSLRVQ